MEKYNKFLQNITELVEKGLVSSKDLKKEMEQSIKIKLEDLINRLNLVSREEFEIQKKITDKLRKDLSKIKGKEKIRTKKAKKL